MSFIVTLSPAGEKFEVPEGSTILDASLAAGKKIPYSCKDGSCGTCKALVLNGKIDQEFDNYDGISEVEIKAGYILTCVASLESDAEIESEYLSELDDINEVVLPCKVSSLVFPAIDIAVLQLRLPPSAEFKYIAGQYVDLIISDQKRSYSIANVISDDKTIELHIRKVEGGYFSNLIFNELKVGQLLRLNGPFGTFFVRKNSSPILFLAGGTGFAPVKAMVEKLLSENSTRKISVYWGVKSLDHLYSDLPAMWQKENNNIEFIPVLSELSKSGSGRTGMVHEAMLEDIDNFSEYQVYACGSPEMISVAKASFSVKGMLEQQFFADAFTPFNK